MQNVRKTEEQTNKMIKILNDLLDNQRDKIMMKGQWNHKSEEKNNE